MCTLIVEIKKYQKQVATQPLVEQLSCGATRAKL